MKRQNKQIKKEKKISERCKKETSVAANHANTVPTSREMGGEQNTALVSPWGQHRRKLQLWTDGFPQGRTESSISFRIYSSRMYGEVRSAGGIQKRVRRAYIPVTQIIQTIQEEQLQQAQIILFQGMREGLWQVLSFTKKLSSELQRLTLLVYHTEFQFFLTTVPVLCKATGQLCWELPLCPFSLLIFNGV